MNNASKNHKLNLLIGLNVAVFTGSFFLAVFTTIGKPEIFIWLQTIVCFNCAVISLLKWIEDRKQFIVHRITWRVFWGDPMNILLKHKNLFYTFFFLVVTFFFLGCMYLL